MIYYRKPSVVEAMQFTGSMESANDIIDWSSHWAMWHDGGYASKQYALMLRTDHTLTEVKPRDYVVKEGNGFRVVSEDDFSEMCIMSEGATFGDVLVALRQGCKARRAGWLPDRYISHLHIDRKPAMAETPTDFIQITRKYNDKDMTTIWGPLAVDMFATDWIIEDL